MNTATSISFWMICSFANMAAPHAHADLVNYTLDNVRLADNTQMLGTFSWTFNVGDVDGDTDGADFLKWQRGEVSSPPSASDLVAWEANYGTGPPLSAVSAAVPEPSAVLLGMMASLIGISFRRHSKPT